MAQSSVRHVAVAAQAFAERSGNFDNLNVEARTEIDSVFLYRGAKTPASGSRTASVFGQGHEFAAAAYSYSRCYWIRIDFDHGKFILKYASNSSSLDDCVAGKYTALSFSETSLEGWRT